MDKSAAKINQRGFLFALGDARFFFLVKKIFVRPEK